MPRIIAERADTIPALAEVFREHGYDGASLALIGKATGLGKGSLYHFFPGGKEEMAAAVLAEIDGWFAARIFAPLAEATDPAAALRDMLDATEAYFRSGRRACLLGAFALSDTRDRFAAEIRRYFARWVDAAATPLRRGGMAAEDAHALAEDIVLGIQGALVLARALDDPDSFARAMERLKDRLPVP